MPIPASSIRKSHARLSSSWQKIHDLRGHAWKNIDLLQFWWLMEDSFWANNSIGIYIGILKSYSKYCPPSRKVHQPTRAQMMNSLPTCVGCFLLIQLWKLSNVASTHQATTFPSAWFVGLKTPLQEIRGIYLWNRAYVGVSRNKNLNFSIRYRPQITVSTETSHHWIPSNRQNIAV